jgi:hypothetical protein
MPLRRSPAASGLYQQHARAQNLVRSLLHQWANARSALRPQQASQFPLEQKSAFCLALIMLDLM